ncbi:MAG: lamin tail domain-containing protein, partial [Bacteroidales bacterium]
MHPLFRLPLLYVLLFLLPAPLSGQGIVINEFMSLNETTAADEDGDYPDWIELYNGGNSTIDLQGYGLSDRPVEPFRWVLPQVEVPPGGYLLIWASGKDRSDSQQPLHASFSINNSGEPLLLTHPQGTLIDSVPPIEIPADLSFGRKPSGGSAWLFFTDATPGADNVSRGFT